MEEGQLKVSEQRRSQEMGMGPTAQTGMGQGHQGWKPRPETEDKMGMREMEDMEDDERGGR